MATLATFFRRSDLLGRTAAWPASQTKPTDAYALRPLPHEDVFLFAKQIDNSRLVREPDPRSKGDCWSAIGIACVLAVLLTSVLAPGVGGILAGYQVQNLKQEQQKLLDEWRALEVEEARLLSPARLDELANAQKLVNPSPGQVIRLDSKPDGSLALNLNSH